MKIVFMISSLLLILIAIPLYMGKCANMIAGYNTMSLENKQKYKELKLCRVLAITLTVAAIILILGAVEVLSYNDTILICIIVLIGGAILANIK